MNRREMTPEEKKIQKIINKLMAEEFVAYMLYMGAISATDQSSVFFKLFTELAKDELDDHYQKLKEFAKINEFCIPFKFRDCFKHAEASVKQLENLKCGQDASYYINEAIKAEQDAIKSYEEAFQCECIPYELSVILTQNYYDECQHLEDLSILKYAFEAGATLCNY